MNVISLFAGIGGIDLGLERAGMTTVSQVELDDAARGVLAHHWPDVVRFTDVREVTADDVPQPIDLIAAGFPCQDLSVAGRRAGLRGERSSLFWEIVRLAAELRPTWLLLENVPGLLSSEVDDGEHRCVCGWTHRRRGLHLRRGDVPTEEQERSLVLAGRRGGDDAEGTAGAADAAPGVRRTAVRDAGGNGEVGCRLDVARTRAESGGGVAAMGTAPRVEAGAGEARDPRGRHQEVAASSWHRTSEVDDGCGGPLRHDPDTDQGVEPEGTECGPVPEAAVPGSEAGCPACGRAVGDSAGRPVRRSGMGTVLGRLADLGFHLAFRVMDAQYFGVPQRRRRVFIVGRVGDGAGPVRVLLEPDSSGRDPAPSAAEGTRVAALSAGGADGRGWRIGADEAAAGQLIPFDAAQITHPENRVNPQPGDPSMPLAATGQPHVAYALRSDPGGTGQGHNTTYAPVSLAVAGDFSSSEDVAQAVTSSHGQTGVVAHADATETHAREVLHRLRDALGTEGLREWCAGVAAALQPSPVLRPGVHEGGLPQEAEDLYRELVNHAQAGTAPASGWAMRALRNVRPGGRASRGRELAEQLAGELETALSFLSPARAQVAVRRLTPREAERLQGFPDDWTATSNGKRQADSPRYRQLGDAVAVPVLEWIGRRIIADQERGAA